MDACAIVYSLGVKMELTDHEMLRYNRQIILKSVDFDGQEKLKASRVLIVGLGGLAVRHRNT